MTFAALFVTDVCWAFYINHVKEGTALKAASWATFMLGIGAFGVISYVSNPWLLIPALLGAFAGTYSGVCINNRKTIQTESK